jgi:hypothetical protein
MRLITGRAEKDGILPEREHCVAPCRFICRAGSRWACYLPQNGRNPTIRCRPCGKAVYQKWLQYIHNKVYI